MSERLAIARVGRWGDGISDTPGGPVYVPYALPGETVEVEEWPGHPDRRRLIEIEIPSPERIAPICPHFGVCGGCAFQHWASARYRRWKRALLIDALAQFGIETAVDDLIHAHGEGRRRAVFHARRGTHDLLELGFAARKQHRVVSIDRCPILAPTLAGAIAAAWAIAEQLDSQRKPLDIQATATDAGMDMDVRGSGPLSPLLMAELARVAQLHRLARLTRHGELIAQSATPTVHIGRAAVALPPGAFLQATQAGENALAKLVEGHCAQARSVADLFCGVGPFALRLAERIGVVAIDNDAPAVEALRRAHSHTRGLKPIRVEVRDLFRRPLRPEELNRLDAVVFDPPREGASAQAHALAASSVATVVAVSCNPSALARDARILLDGGYQIAQVTPVDQFLFSTHVEVVARFDRMRAKRRRR
ncbi:MAG TPA: methyltransferase [Xanthobacteraceae bacterium]|jgi:23S rRNA (uracil1939-C5)-methyltransferase